jgi:hypothetical protein
MALKLMASSSLIVLPGAAMAHEGHGSSNLAIHNLEHSLVLLGAIALLSIAMVMYRKAKQQKVDR